MADHDAGVGRFQELKVLQPDPFTLDDVVPECVGTECPVVFEGDYDAEHGQVTDQQKPDGAGKHHGGQPEGFLLGCHTSEFAPAFRSCCLNCRHVFSSAPLYRCPIW